MQLNINSVSRSYFDFLGQKNVPTDTITLLKWVQFRKAQFRKVQFRKAQFRKAQFRKAQFRKAQFRKAQFRKAQFRKAQGTMLRVNILEETRNSSSYTV